MSLSAIADLTNAQKENTSLQKLARISYQDNDLKNAAKYTAAAMEDALDSKAQIRVTQLAKLNRNINSAFQSQLTESKRNLQISLAIVGALSMLLIAVFIYIYRQMVTLSRTKHELTLANEALARFNDDLNMKNESLSHANSLRERYIMQFLEMCSLYIDKMESYRLSLNKIAANRKIEELYRQLKSTTMLDRELEELYRKFDSIFLSLYPGFVDEFNALLDEEERITLKDDNILTKELRIYALLRLGITDSNRIASFLHCSLSTVYNYRTRMRNKAGAGRESFEKNVMNIGSKKSPL